MADTFPIGVYIKYTVACPHIYMKPSKGGSQFRMSIIRNDHASFANFAYCMSIVSGHKISKNFRS